MRIGTIMRVVVFLQSPLLTRNVDEGVVLPNPGSGQKEP